MKAKFWMMTMAAGMMLALSACSSSEGGDSADPLKPSTPISDDDWQMVSSSGGTIEKDSISLTFPSGTFSEETKVAITEVRKGELYGSYEASPFYQIMLPSKTDRPITVNIKANDQSGNLRMVALTPSYRKSAGENVTHSLSLDAYNAGGYYSVTLPASTNDADDDDTSITLGLIDASSVEGEDAGTRSWNVIQGKVGNLEWYYDIGTWDYLTMGANLSKWKEMKPRVNEYITDAINKIHDLGFKINTSRKIPFILVNDKGHPDAYGFFDQDSRYDEWSTIELNMVKLFSGIDETSIKQTVIHELLHYFEADYDPRSSFKKELGGEENVISEAASVWVEQFMDGGKLNGNFVSEYLPDFIKGFEDIESIYPNTYNKATSPVKWKQKRNSNFDQHGYGMGALLYYITSPMSEMEAFGIDKTKIVELFQMWKSIPAYAGYTFSPFKKWLMDHDCGFLDTGAYDDFLLHLLAGEVIDHPKINAEGLSSATNAFVTFNGDVKKEKEGTCLDLGCAIDKVTIGSYKDSEGNYSFKGKDIVVKQLKPDVQTCVIVQSYDTNKFELVRKVTVMGDSIVINGEDLDNIFNKERKKFLWLVTTNHSGKAKPYGVSAEMRDHDDSEFTMLNVNSIRFDTSLTIQEEGRDWTDKAEIVFSEYWSGVDFTVSQAGDRVHINAVWTHHSVESDGSVFDYRDDLSFDILGFSGNLANCRIENLVYSNKHDIDWSGDVEDGYVSRVITEASCSLTDIKAMETNLYPDVQYPGETSKRNSGIFRFGGQYPDAFTIKDVTEKDTYYEAPDEKMSVHNSSWVKNPEDNILLVIDFNYSSKQHK